MDIFAIVRIRGVRSMKPRTKKTLELLMLLRPNHCVVCRATPQLMGMLNVAKDYIAYGPIKEEALLALVLKRGEKGGKCIRELMKDAEIKAAVKAVFEGKKVSEFIDPVFRLHPP
ncbi:uL30 family ribosomal protein, partial [Candidatus Micrarchaeota archaeon]|nr:uL30 family ribosomal protein [Candidatus Micrarchaeota archaeon]